MELPTTITWYRSKVDKQVLRDLMRKSDARAFLQVGLQLGLFVATGTLAYLVWRQLNAGNWPVFLPLLLLVLFIHGTNGSFFGGVACHELGHKTPFSTQIWNAVFLRIYAFLAWFDPVGYRASHIRHHQVTVHRAHDGEVEQPLGLDWYGFRFVLAELTLKPKWIWRILRFTAAAAVGNLTRDGVFKSQWLRRVVPETDGPGRRELVTWARVVLCGHLALAAGFIFTGYWFLIIIVNFGTFYCNWLATLCSAPQHAGLSSDVNDFRLNTRSYTCNALAARLYWNMQYHVEHHMFPAVPFYNLPRLHTLIAHDLPPVTHGLWAAWRETQSILRRQRRDATFVYVPPLPNSSGDHTSVADLFSEATPPS